MATEKIIFIKKKNTIIEPNILVHKETDPDESVKEEYIAFLENIYEDVLQARHRL